MVALAANDVGAEMSEFTPYRMISTPIRRSAEWVKRLNDGIPEARRHPDELPLAGTYRLQLTKGAPWMPAKIWIVEHRDPVTREYMADVEYHAEIGCEAGIVRLGMTPDPALKPPRDVWSLWEWPGLEICTVEDHDYLTRMLLHALTREGDLAEANPRRPVNRLSQPVIL